MQSIESARAAGLTQYFTGEPCVAGHTANRFVSSRQCVLCSHRRKREWAAKNKDHVLAYQREYIEANRANINKGNRARAARNPERHKKLKAADYQRHKNKRLATMKRWRENNPDIVQAGYLAKVAANPEQYRTYKRNYKVRRRLASGTHTGDDIFAILKAQKSRCAYCRVKLGSKYHVDHIVALAKGGSNDRRNLQVLCQPCNQSKSAKDPIVFAQSLGMLV